MKQHQHNSGSLLEAGQDRPSDRLVAAARGVKVVHDENCDTANMVRIDGRYICPVCELPPRKHPYCKGSPLPESMCSSSFPEYFLHVLCDGRHVKL